MLIVLEIFLGVDLDLYRKKSRLKLRTKKRKKKKLWFLACLPNLVLCVKNGLPPGRDSWSTLLFIQVQFVFVSFRFSLPISILLLLWMSGAKCLMEVCEWTNPIAKEKTRMNREQLKQHMLSAHSESIPTA